MHGTTRINLPTITFFTCLCLFQTIHLNFLLSHVAPSQGYAYPVHYAVLFQNLGGYYNSLILQASEIPPEWHQAGDEKKATIGCHLVGQKMQLFQSADYVFFIKA